MDTTEVRSDQDSYRERLGSLADAIEEADEAVGLLRVQRDELITEAVEGRHGSTHEVARWVRLSQPRVIGIVAKVLAGD